MPTTGEKRAAGGVLCKGEVCFEGWCLFLLLRPVPSMKDASVRARFIYLLLDFGLLGVCPDTSSLFGISSFS